MADRDLFGARIGEYIVPEYTQSDTCRSCKAYIIWLVAKGRKWMPLSAATIEERDGVRYALPHFVDCPHAKEWK